MTNILSKANENKIAKIRTFNENSSEFHSPDFIKDNLSAFYLTLHTELNESLL